MLLTTYSPAHASVLTYGEILAFLFPEKYHGSLASFSVLLWLHFYTSPLTHFLDEMVIFLAVRSWPELEQMVGLLFSDAWQ